MASSARENLDRLQTSLDPNALLDAVHECLETMKRVKEARGATSLPEAKLLIECGLIRDLTEIALQAARVVKWTPLADKLCDQLREIRDRQSAVEFVYLNGIRKQKRIRLMQDITDPPKTGDWELEKLSSFNPQIYRLFLNNLNNLIVLFETFKVRPFILIATQAIAIGKQACALGNMLYILLEEYKSADAMRLNCFYFTHTILLSAMLKDFDDLVFRVHSTHEIRGRVWEYLSNHGYKERDLQHLSKYALLVVEDIFPGNDGNDICAYALLNHDIMYPFPSPDPDGTPRSLMDCEEDFKYPFVVIEKLVVRPSYRHCGIGGAFVRHIAKMARINGYTVVSVEESEQMLATQGFWNVLKFKPSPYCQGWYERELDNPHNFTVA
jgi:GNAT superfamily N-acetyltransferase